MFGEGNVEVFDVDYELMMEGYGVSDLFQSTFSILASFYQRLTIMNVAIFFFKYVPTSIYLLKLVRDSYKKMKEKMYTNRAALEDIQLQIDIMNTKIGVRNTEMVERTSQLKRAAQRLREIRAKVKELLNNNEELKRLRDLASNANNEVHGEHNTVPQDMFDDKDFMNGLLKEFKCGNQKGKEMQKMDCGDPTQKIIPSPETSVYCSLSGIDDVNKDCNVKIVKVTNVYKVAYLKNYVKQRRLRRASKQAMLEKKMTSIKQLLEDWQKTLETVYNLKEHSLERGCQEETIETKTNDSNSDLNKSSEVYPEENETNWDVQNGYEEYPRTKIGFDAETYMNLIQTANECQNKMNEEIRRRDHSQSSLFILPEETSSQMEIEDVKMLKRGRSDTKQLGGECEHDRQEMYQQDVVIY